MTILLFGSNSDFKDADPGVLHKYEDLIAPPRILRTLGWNHDLLTEGHLSTLAAFANWRDSFPAQSPSQGRTLYAETVASSNWNVRGIKLKGAGGLTLDQNTGRWLCYAPMPGTKYGQVEEFHVALTEDLSIETKSGQPKALNSLRANAAQNEYDLQRQLARAGVGFNGLMYGKFFTKEGSDEVDLHGNNTGAVCIEFDPSYSLAGKFVKFIVIPEKDGSERVAYNELSHLENDNPTPQQLRTNFISMFRRMASAKHTAFFEAGVGRHAAHYDNFYFNLARERMFVTDVDSAVSVVDLEPQARGRQFLRDVAQDARRMISALSYSSFTPQFLSDLKDGTLQPFKDFLQAYSGDRVPEEALNLETKGLQETYLRYVGERKGRLDWIASELGKKCRGENENIPERLIFSNWDTAHLKFLAPCLLAVYKIIKAGDFKSVGIQLPEVTEAELGGKFKSGMEAHCQKVQKASESLTGSSAGHFF